MRQAFTAKVLAAVAVGMLSLGFASKPLYDTFCKVTGYGGTTKQAQTNESEILDREVTVFFDSNVAGGLPWEFKQEQVKMTVNVGQSGLAYYKVVNTSERTITGTATYNVTPIKAAPFFVKTECFCFTEQTIEPGQEVSFPVLFHVDSQIDEEKRLDDVRDITLSYTFFEIEPSESVKTSADSSVNTQSLN
ncbi:MAG: cytochrome c oxidase assembly protein [Maricaulaceae bacterium]